MCRSSHRGSGNSTSHASRMAACPLQQILSYILQTRYLANFLISFSFILQQILSNILETLYLAFFFDIIQLILHHLWEACRHLPQHLPCCLLSRPIKSWFKSRRRYFSSLPQTVAKNLKTSQKICSPSCAASQGCPRRRGREGAGWCPCPACSSCSCTWWRR